MTVRQASRMLAMTFVALAVLSELGPTRVQSQATHTYGGVTWIGDDCRVNDDGALVCIVRPEA